MQARRATDTGSHAVANFFRFRFGHRSIGRTPPRKTMKGKPTRAETTDTDRMDGTRSIAGRLRRSRASIDRAIAKHGFPRSLKFRSSSRWLQSDAERYIAGNTASRAAG